MSRSALKLDRGRVRLPTILLLALTLALGIPSLATSAPSKGSVAGSKSTLTFGPDQDTYVDSQHAQKSFGTTVSFWVDGSPTIDGLLRFPITGIGSQTITDVRLRLYQTDSSPTGGRVWSFSSTTWNESVTWDSRPAIDGPLLGSFGAVSANQWYEIDLGATPVSGDGAISLAIDSVNADGARWSTRESSYDPQLLVDMTSGPTDAFAFTPVADAYVDAGNPASTFGTRSSGWVDGAPTKQLFLRFDVAGLTGRSIVGAHVRMYQTDAAPVGGSIFSLTSNAWTESVTWNTRPAIDGPQLGTFGSVQASSWYEADLNRSDVFPLDGVVSLALQSTNSDGARWATRESETPPQLILDVARVSGLVVDGVSQVATGWQGSTQPTYYASNHRLAVTSSGRLLTVFGEHVTGVQLAWRDAGGGWLSTSTGDATDGVLDRNGATGERPASIAVARDSSGIEHAWVVWSGSASDPSVVELRRLSDLDDSEGPSIGPDEDLVPDEYEPSRADLAFETAPDGTERGCVVWTARDEDSMWQVNVGWLTDLDSDEPSLENTATLIEATSPNRVATLVPTSTGIRVIARSNDGKLQEFGHDAAAPLTSWWTGTPGISTSTYAYASGTGLDTGEVLAAIESSTSSHVVSVERFSPAGVPTLDLQLTGYSQPTIASDGAGAWLVMIRTADGFVVSRHYTPGSGWETVDRVEVGADTGGAAAWPSAIRRTDGRLRFVVRGAGADAYRHAVLAFQRTL